MTPLPTFSSLNFIPLFVYVLFAKHVLLSTAQTSLIPLCVLPHEYKDFYTLHLASLLGCQHSIAFFHCFLSDTVGSSIKSQERKHFFTMRLSFYALCHFYESKLWQSKYALSHPFSVLFQTKHPEVLRSTQRWPQKAYNHIFCICPLQQNSNISSNHPFHTLHSYFCA